MTFKPGQSGNPKGRTPGRRNAKTRAVLGKLNGVADALALLGEMVASAEAPLALRVTAATALAPYQYPKAPRLLRKEIDLPEPVTIEDATANIARIGVFAAARRIGLSLSEAVKLQRRGGKEAGARGEIRRRGEGEMMPIKVETSCGKTFEVSTREMSDRQLEGLLRENEGRDDAIRSASMASTS